MSHADRPYLTRPLAGVDQALGEGGARPPVELLDQLRERLAGLDANHPSASPRSLDQDVANDQAADQAAAPPERVQAPRPDGPSLRKEGSDRSSEHQPGDRGAGEPPAVRQAGQSPPAAADGAVDSLAADGQYRVAEAGGAAKGERYRPWFADEPGPPWFVE